MSDQDPLNLQWLLFDGTAARRDLFANYCEEVANGPMTSYRAIAQSGEKQGQTYYIHVLDLVTMLHKLRQADAIALEDLEEQLLFATATIHDLNKIPPYGGHDQHVRYTDVTTHEYIRAELRRLDMRRFWPEWEHYVPDIRLLAHLHQHDAAPLEDLDHSMHEYHLEYERLLDLGNLLYALDNLDLSHTLSERKHKQNFLHALNAISSRRWRWLTHRLSENRGLLSNMVHNTVATYLLERHEGKIVPLLYYSEGTAYLLSEREVFPWGEEDYRAVAQRLDQAIAGKKSQHVQKFVEKNPRGFTITDAAIESGVSLVDILAFIYQQVLRKKYNAGPHADYLHRLRSVLQKVADSGNQVVAALASARLTDEQSLVPFDQDLLKCGELVLAYYNILSKFPACKLPSSRQEAIWERIYRLMELPESSRALYAQVDRYKRANFIARDSKINLETLYQRLLADLSTLIGEPGSSDPAFVSAVFHTYLKTSLEIEGASYPRDFTAHLRQYIEAGNSTCCSCSSSFPSQKLMSGEVPALRKVQVFTNRQAGGGGEPKRNVCPICRTQYILEKMTTIPVKKTFKGKQEGNAEKKEEIVIFYLHLFPFAFFTAPYLDAMYSTLKRIRGEDQRSLFLSAGRYLARWEERFRQQLADQATQMAARVKETGHEVQDQAGLPRRPSQDFSGWVDTSIGIALPGLSEAVSNIPTLPIQAPGANYHKQFLFALLHALMIADFFSCRVVLSGLPVPPISGEYLANEGLVFFVDAVPADLRWLLPTNECRSLEAYRKNNALDGGPDYLGRRAAWSHELPDEQGYAAFEHIYRRLATLYRIAQELHAEDRDALVLQFISAATSNPFSVYHVADLAIEKAVRVREHTSEHQNSNTRLRKVSARQGTPPASAPAQPAEQRAIILSQRIAPFLKELM